MSEPTHSWFADAMQEVIGKAAAQLKIGIEEALRTPVIIDSDAFPWCDSCQSYHHSDLHTSFYDVLVEELGMMGHGMEYEVAVSFCEMYIRQGYKATMQKDTDVPALPQPKESQT